MNRESEPETTNRQWWTLAVVCAATFVLLLDVTIVVVALPDVQQDLRASFSSLQWFTNAYALTLACILLTTGSLADRYGRRRMFIIGLAIFTTASLLCGVAQDELMLIVSRAVQGVGGSMLFATSLALLASTFQGKQRGMAFGVWASVASIATALGPLLGGVITTEFSWRGIFLVNLPIGVAALVVALRQVDESRSPHEPRIDWYGAAALTAALFSLVYGLIRVSDTAWSERGVLLCFGLALAFLVVFVVVETRVDEPLFDLSLLRIPTFLGGSIAAFTMNASMFAMFLYLVLYLQGALGHSALGSGTRLLVASICTFVAALAAGRYMSRIPARWLLGPGLGLVGVGLLLMRGLSADSTWTHLIAGLVVSGIGTGMVNPPLASTAVGVVPVYRSGMASGASQTFRQIGMAVGIALYGSIFTASLSNDLTARLSGIPGLQSRSGEMAEAIRRGSPVDAIGSTVPEVRGRIVDAVKSSYASALNDLLLASGILALVGGLLAFALVRAKDFVPQQNPARVVSISEERHSPDRADT